MLDKQTLYNINEIDERELQFLKAGIDYSHAQSLPEIWPIAAEKFGENIALRSPHM